MIAQDTGSVTSSRPAVIEVARHTAAPRRRDSPGREALASDRSAAHQGYAATKMPPGRRAMAMPTDIDETNAALQLTMPGRVASRTEMYVTKAAAAPNGMSFELNRP